jgi:hypothetical protein
MVAPALPLALEIERLVAWLRQSCRRQARDEQEEYA